MVWIGWITAWRPFKNNKWNDDDDDEDEDDDDDEVYDDNAEVSIHILLLPLLPPTHLPMVDMADTPQNNDTSLILWCIKTGELDFQWTKKSEAKFVKSLNYMSIYIIKILLF